jgi:2-methylisocitrate lyase-like PEP mutase family enzyme
MMTQHDKAAAFRALHEGEPFVIPNPWDAGAARVLEGLGFKALATTSSGFAFTLGRRDGDTTLDELAAHVGVLAAATALPLAVDLEDGKGDPADAITRMAHAGAVGASIEDSDGRGLYPLDEALARLTAAIAAARALDLPFTLTARAEGQIRGGPGLDDTIARLQAYESAGADVLFAPGLRTIDEVRAVCGAVTKPVNVLGHKGLVLSEVLEAGAQRVSVGGALTWVAVTAMTDAAERIRDGDLSALSYRPPKLD